MKTDLPAGLMCRYQIKVSSYYHTVGNEEAINAGKILKEKGFEFDLVHTSVLKRAIMTFNNIAEAIDHHHIPMYKTWRLNERHYGALQGLNKAETAEKHGDDQVKIWRRSFDIPPPELDETDERHPSHEKKYAKIPKQVLPKTEVTYHALNVCSR